MTDPQTTKDELAGTEQPFVQHLKELRDRLIYSLIGLVVCMVALAIWPSPAGLYGHEKRLAIPLIFFGSFLAYTGIGFVQFFVLDKMFAFIQAVTPDSVSATPDIASYVEAILGLYLAFGVAFQVPIVVVLLARMKIVTLQQLKDFRGYFIVLSFVVAAVLTPPDVISQLALAIPMCLLYEAGIWASKLFIKHTQAPAEESEPSKP